MVLSTILVRASDALPLAASVDDEQTEQALQEHKQQSKLIFRRITPNSEPRCSIESGHYTLHYLISENVVFLTIADKSYPRKLAFSYLDELSKEFATTYGAKVDAVRKPYAFVGFDTFMSKTARLYRDTRTATAATGSGLDKLNDDLQDVTRIMTKNMEELLWRGDSLDSNSKKKRGERKKKRAARRQREKEQHSADAELRKARERDAIVTEKERRKSANQSTQPQPFPSTAGYPTTPYTAGYNAMPPAGAYDQRERKHSANMGDINQQFREMDLTNQAARPLQYQTDAERARKLSNNLGQQAPYGAAYPTTAYPVFGNPSPNMRPAETPQAAYSASAYVNANYPAGASTTPAMAHPSTPYNGAVYPPGHVLAGKPIPAGATPPIPGLVASTSGQPAYQSMPVPATDTGDQGQLPAPDGFSRPVSAITTFTPFDKMRLDDMNELVLSAPRMPVVLQAHDVQGGDWTRFMQVILYKGRERRSGPQAGMEDIQLPLFDSRDDSSSSSSSTSDSDSDSDDPRFTNNQMYMYDQQSGQGMTEIMERKRRRREIKAEKKQRRKEKRARRKARAREKKYSLYIACVPPGGVQPGMGGAVPGVNPMAGMPMNPSAYGGAVTGGVSMNPAAYGGAVTGGMPMTSHAGAYGM
ncbi:Protein transport protein sec22 [Mycena indigotica]|uniref:Protein transport protein SEC22 n=1 Tax=Mycena indigotica TaxID=2126181 RepID=A0A8H6SLC0_9AGAR|nr:Protein transport protein sec22 [Mycena indigotica]KAF7301521.1 Protein transport protein sec22 [Mycena indigotica]